MVTYKFEQFNTEIINPTITVDVNAIQVHAERGTISLVVTLETSNSKIYGVELKDIPVSNLSYEGLENLMTRALEGLEKYKL
jgi:hypothetical protein